MKNEKALTLIELLTVIIILGILALVTIPVITNIFAKQKEKTYYNQLNQLILAGQNWVSDHDIGNGTGTCTIDNWKILTLTSLKNGDNNISYLPKEFINPKTKKEFSGENTFVYVYKKDKTYFYCVSTPECTNISFNENKDMASKICCDGEEFKTKTGCNEIPNPYSKPTFVIEQEDYSQEKNVTVNFSETGNYLIFADKNIKLNVNAQKCSSAEAENFNCNLEVVNAGNLLENEKWYLVKEQPRIIVTEDNTEIIAKVTNGEEFETDNIKITKIDRTPPTDLKYNVAQTSNKITINVISSSDDDSGIYGYQYELRKYIDDVNYESDSTEITTDESKTFEITSSGKYKVVVKTINNTYKYNGINNLNTKIDISGYYDF